MTDDNSSNESPLPAGAFSNWIADMQAAMLGQSDAEVPCGGCTACCTSSQFVHIARDESDTLAHIPADLLFPAPRLPIGTVLLGYDEAGHCPMLVDNQCSIYLHRPRTCRTYDCRIFPAAGLQPDDDQAPIAQQARRWQFAFPTATDRVEHDAVRAAAAYLDGHWDSMSGAVARAPAAPLAAMAIDIHHLFLAYDQATGQRSVIDPDPVVVQAEIDRLTAD
jgi:Fe-S-cluster containining protein